MSQIKVSIIIPLYNGSHLITRCLNSIFNQIGEFDLQVIIIDDGSTDNSADIVKQYPHSVTLLQQPNQGPAAARNKGIKAANGKYLAFLDGDDYWEPTFLRETVTFLEIQKNAIAVSVGQKHLTFKRKSTIIPTFLKTEPEKIKDPLILDNFFIFWGEHFHVCTGSILIRSEITKETGGQRIDLRITEDLEFWAYLATFGPIGFIPQVLFISDGVRVTKQLGWLNKNRKRWDSAPTIEKWEERIVLAIKDKDYEPYQKVRGKIAKNLCYSLIMSGRSSLAKKTVLAYSEHFPTDRVANFLKIGARKKLFWLVTVWLIKIREYTRFINFF